MQSHQDTSQVLLEEQGYLTSSSPPKDYLCHCEPLSCIDNHMMHYVHMVVHMKTMQRRDVSHQQQLPANVSKSYAKTQEYNMNIMIADSDTSWFEAFVTAFPVFQASLAHRRARFATLETALRQTSSPCESKLQ